MSKNDHKTSCTRTMYLIKKEKKRYIISLLHPSKSNNNTFQKKKKFFFVSSFIFLEDYMNYDISLDLEHNWHCGETWIVCVISAKLFLILCEYVLVCIRTQGLIEKLIFLVYVPSIA